MGDADQASSRQTDPSRSTRRVVEEQQRVNSMQLLPIALDHIYALTDLPPYHKDPFDRLIVAQALTEGWPVVGDDSKFGAYGVQLVW